MEKKQLTRTCLACGASKPIAAFLNLSGTQGTIYGNICSACRSSGAKNIAVDTGDERGGSRTDVRIDAKAKLQLELELKLLMEKHKEDDKDERKKLEKDAEDKNEKVISKEEAEKTHRINYIDAKHKPNFLNYKQKMPVGDPTTHPNAQDKSIFNQKQNESLHNTQQKEESRKQEMNQTTEFSSGASIDPAIAGLRFQVGESQQRLEALLGPNALMSTVKNRFGIKAKEVAKETPAAGKDPIVDYVKNNAAPNSTRRR